MAFLHTPNCMATVGSSSRLVVFIFIYTSVIKHFYRNRNVCLWDTLLPPTRALVSSPLCHPGGGTSIVFSSSIQVSIFPFLILSFFLFLS